MDGPNTNELKSVEVSLTQQPVKVAIDDKQGPIISIFSLIMSSIAIAFSGYTFFYSELREGNLEVISPSRVAWVRLGEGDQIHGRSKSDILLVSFVIHNNGNKLRAIKSIDLKLNDGSKDYSLEAVGKFDKLKDITYFTEKALEGRIKSDDSGNPIPDYNYSLITSIPILKNEYYIANFLFLIDNELPDNFLYLDESKTYTGKINVSPFDLKKNKDKVDICFKFNPKPILKRVMVSTDDNLAC